MFGVKRNDEEEAKAEYKEFITFKKRNAYFSKKISNIEKSGNVFGLFVLFIYRKSRNYLSRE